MATRLIIIGAGAHARVVWDVVRRSGDVDVLGFVDRRGSGKVNLGDQEGAILGDDSQIATLLSDPVVRPMLGLGASFLDIRHRLTTEYGIDESRWYTAVHPTATMADSARLGAGAVVMAGAVVNPDASIGAHSVINSGAIIEHDCEIGSNTFVQPGATLAGGVRVGDNTVIGVGASVIDGATIGSGSIVGGGAFVRSDVPDFTCVAGVPARVLRDNPDPTS